MPPGYGLTQLSIQGFFIGGNMQSPDNEEQISYHKAEMERYFNSGDREKALQHWRKMRDLINQRTPEMVDLMGRAQGLK